MGEGEGRRWPERDRARSAGPVVQAERPTAHTGVGFELLEDEESVGDTLPLRTTSDYAPIIPDNHKDLC